MLDRRGSIPSNGFDSRETFISEGFLVLTKEVGIRPQYEDHTVAGADVSHLAQDETKSGGGEGNRVPRRNIVAIERVKPTQPSEKYKVRINARIGWANLKRIKSYDMVDAADGVMKARRRS